MNSPKYIINAHQTHLRTVFSDKKINIAVFDILDLQNYYVEIDDQRCPRGGVLVINEQKEYTQQYKDLKFFFQRIYWITD